VALAGGSQAGLRAEVSKSDIGIIGGTTYHPELPAEESIPYFTEAFRIVLAPAGVMAYITGPGQLSQEKLLRNWIEAAHYVRDIYIIRKIMES